ncbi:unnamed protein product [Peniophora sp. CBMAI 1063]|nr:unnamed protein product [Peniophora sp. CBMAI 1063]
MSTALDVESQEVASETAWFSSMTSCFDSLRPRATPSTLREADVELAALEAMQTHVYRHIVMARTRRNTLIPACSLPAELLSYIFKLVRPHWKPQRRRAWPLPYYAGWMSLTHVCSLWRRIILDDPTLWCYIDCNDIPCAAIDTILQRSRGQPLHINVDFEGNRGPDHDQNSWTWMSKPLRPAIQSLNVRVKDMLLDALLPLEMPRLEELTIHDFGMLPAAYLLAASSEVFPRLRRLDLYRTIPSWTSPLFSSTLTHLKIATMGGDAQFPSRSLSVPNALRILSRLPNLLHLELRNVFAAMASDADEGLPSYTAPIRLKSVRLIFRYGMAVECVAGFLQASTFSVSTSIVVQLEECARRDTVHAAVQGLFRDMNYAPQAMQLVLGHNLLQLWPWQHSELAFTPVVDPHEDSLDMTIPGLRSIQVWDCARTRFNPDSDDSVEDATLFLPHLPRGVISSIALLRELELPASASAWISTFEGFLGIQHACIGINSHFPSFCAGLQETSSDSRFLLFPRLEAITLGRWGDSPKEKQQAHSRVWSLVAALETRLSAEIPVRVVCLPREAESLDSETWIRLRQLAEVSYFD